MNYIKPTSKILAFLCVMFLVACTPKVAEPDVQEDPVKELPDRSDDPCATFEDSKMGQGALDNYVIYRDDMKRGNLEDAYENWQKAFEFAPGADGKRSTLFEDGIKIQQYFFENADDIDEKRNHMNMVMELYDRMEGCYPETSYADARKAFDYYYKYRDFTTDEEILQLFEKSFKTHGKNVPAFVVNPYTGLMTEMFLSNKIDQQRASVGALRVLDIVEYNVENCKDDCDAWEIVESYAPARLESLEGVKGFYDCNYYKEKYLSEWEEMTTDCDVSRTMLGRLKYAECLEEDPDVQRVLAAVKKNCVVVNETLKKAYDCLENGDYSCAVEYFQKAADETDDVEKKSRYTLLIAKIYYAHLKNFSKSRKYARDAAKIRSNWGDPYILIGKLYASSGPLCGPGTGFESQRVVWVAIDKWNYAKKIDPSVASEAQSNINKYYQYMPTKGDLFSRLLSEGDSYTVDCWINEKTVVRAKK